MAFRGRFYRLFQVVLVVICAFPAGLAAQSYPEPLPTPRQAPRTPNAATAAITTGARPATSPAVAQELARRKANENVVTIMGSGRQTGYTQFAEDISNVIEGIKGNELRVIPVLGKSAGQNIMDMLYLKGMDMGIVDRDIIDYLKKKDPALYGDLDKRIYYLAKLFNFELHIYAKKDVKSLEDLAGKKVSCLKEGSTVAIMCTNLFKALKIDVQIVFEDGDLARQKVVNGEIAAAVRGANPPIPGFDKIKPEENLHFLPISEETLPNSDFNAVRAMYLPARLKHEDYPNLIPDGEDVPTIATSTLLAVYAWPPGSVRYQRLEKFVQLFFDNIDGFRKAPRHPKWVDVNLAAEVPGWTRFPPAQAWLNAKRKATASAQPTGSTGAGGAASNGLANDAKMKAAFNKFLDDYAKATGSRGTEAQREALYSQFVQWWESVKNKQ
jgi:TRAP-type uncharacterized transport system substrate-binding protein